MARVLAVVSELMLASRVEGALRLAGHEVILRPDLPGGDVDVGEERFDLIVCDLDAVEPAAVAARPEPAIAFYSHVDVEVRKRALAAGLELVVPRSRMSRELPELVKRLLGDRNSGS